MKKFLIVLFCLLGFGLIATLCYFFAYDRNDIVIPAGKYYLSEIKEGQREDDLTSKKIENSDLYLEVAQDGKIKSFSGQTGFSESEIVYEYKVLGTKLSIMLDGESHYEGYYVDDLIIIINVETRVVDEKEQEVYVEYHYKLK